MSFINRLSGIPSRLNSFTLFQTSSRLIGSTNAEFRPIEKVLVANRGKSLHALVELMLTLFEFLIF